MRTPLPRTILPRELIRLHRRSVQLGKARRKAAEEILAWLAAIAAIGALGLAVWMVVEDVRGEWIRRESPGEGFGGPAARAEVH